MTRILASSFLVLSLAQSPAVAYVDSLPEFAVDRTNENTFSTPVAYDHGAVYTINVEPAASGLSNGLNLRTTVRKAVRSGLKGWRWESKVVDDKTLADVGHTQGSIALDKHGYVHIAYGMHNMPWQYAVSLQPGDISSFKFRGDAVSAAEKFAVKALNQTPFPSIGTAAIPGNQVTYPAFFHDRNQDLYVAYRFAARPRRPFADRGYGGGIARYDTASMQWRALGGELSLSPADADCPEGRDRRATLFALRDGWAVYMPRLAFDNHNGMHVSWMWREGGAGADTTRPSYAFSSDRGVSFSMSNGARYSLPIDVNAAESVNGDQTKKTYGPASPIVADLDDVPYIVLEPRGSIREMVRYDRSTRRWSSPEAMPNSASVLQFDDKGDQWAFASGLTVLKRQKGAKSWKMVWQDRGKKKWGWPKVLRVDQEKKFVVHCQSLDSVSVKVVIIDWNTL